MNYKEIRDRIRDLGFVTDSEIESIDEAGTLIPNAINNAISEINRTICPLIGKYEFVQDGTETDLLYYDMEELTKVGNVVKFLELAEPPVMHGTGVYKRFSQYEVERDKIVIIDGSIAGNFKIFYRKQHSQFDENTLDGVECELPLKCHDLIPLLASYYIWQDDDVSKAAVYYNMYLDEKANFVNEIKPKFKIMGGGI